MISITILYYINIFFLCAVTAYIFGYTIMHAILAFLVLSLFVACTLASSKTIRGVAP